MPSVPGHELTGSRLVGQLPTQQQAELWSRITPRIVKYGFAIEYRDLEAPRTGTFNGLTITLDPDVGFEMQCFILLHLFGHNVQWVSPTLAPQLDDLQRTDDFARFMHVLREYEFQAAQLGLQLLHESGVTNLDQWYSDFVETDWQYVKRFYESGQIPPWHECVAKGCQVIEPMPIPLLEKREVAVRFAF